MKFFSKSRRSAFTLIELLVVIAIIGILAAAVFPVVTAQLERARAFGLGARGRNIAQGIIAANIELEALNREGVWPRIGSKPPTHTYSDTSTSYFEWLIGNAYLEGFSFDQLSGAGIPAPTAGANLTSDNVAWSLTAGFKGAEPDVFPFLITRNMKPDGPNQQDVTGQRVPLDETQAPFQNRLGVIVAKGASMQVVRERNLFADVFNPSTNVYTELEMWEP